MLARALLVSSCLLLGACGGGPAPDPVERRVVNALDLGVRAMNDGRERVAIQSFELAIESAERASDGDGAARARYAMAKALLRLGEYASALESADGALATTDDPALLASAHLLAGEAMAGLGRSGAAEQFDLAEKVAPASVSAWSREIAIARAKALVAAGDLSGADAAISALPGGERGLSALLLRLELGSQSGDLDPDMGERAVELSRARPDARLRARAMMYAGLAHEAAGDAEAAAARLLLAGRAFARIDGGRERALSLLERSARLGAGLAEGRAAARTIEALGGSG